MVKNIHRIVGIVLLIISIIWSAALILLGMAGSFTYVVGLTIPGCKVFSPFVELPFIALGTLSAAIIVLCSSYKISGYILFAFSLLLLPRLVVFLAPNATDILCHRFEHSLQQQTPEK